LSIASQKLKIKDLEIQDFAYQILKLLGFGNSTLILASQILKIQDLEIEDLAYEILKIQHLAYQFLEIQNFELARY